MKCIPLWILQCELLLCVTLQATVCCADVTLVIQNTTAMTVQHRFCKFFSDTDSGKDSSCNDCLQHKIRVNTKTQKTSKTPTVSDIQHIVSIIISNKIILLLTVSRFSLWVNEVTSRAKPVHSTIPIHLKAIFYSGQASLYIDI